MNICLEYLLELRRVNDSPTAMRMLHKVINVPRWRWIGGKLRLTP